jgi:hypothetical protein
MELVSTRLTMLSTLNLAERVNWQAQNLLRRTGEWSELQLNRLLEFISRADLPASGTSFNWLEPSLILLARVVAGLVIFILLYWFFKAIISIVSIVRGQRWQRRSTPAQQTPIATQTLEDWLAQATAAQAQQDYATACRALYMALLLYLEKMEWLARNPALTDQEYLRRLNALWVLYPQAAELPQAWTQLIQTHEVLCYGARPASAELFQGCQQSYQRLVSDLTLCRPAVVQ